MRLNHPLLCACLLATSVWPAAAASPPRFDVQFVDAPAAYSSFYAELALATVTAGETWTQHFAGDFSGIELTVQIHFVDIATASGRSLGSGFVGLQTDGSSLWQQGAIHELLTGLDVNGALADVEFRIGIDGYLQSELWFDPDPWQRSSEVPADRTDALSVLLHEWGHALGFNGWMDGRTGLLPGDYASTFDAHVATFSDDAGPTLYFQGPQSMALYGAAVPLTFGSFAHLANDDGRDGADLAADLMNGLSFERGRRYDISALNLAMMADLGVPMMASVPEASTAAQLLAGLGGLALWVRRRRR